jgi:hypothetical protein
VLTVMPWNVENFFAPQPADQAAYDAKLTELAEVIRTAAPDLLAVQEVGDEQSFEALETAELPRWTRRRQAVSDVYQLCTGAAVWRSSCGCKPVGGHRHLTHEQTHELASVCGAGAVSVWHLAPLVALPRGGRKGESPCLSRGFSIVAPTGFEPALPP